MIKLSVAQKYPKGVQIYYHNIDKYTKPEGGAVSKLAYSRTSHMHTHVTAHPTTLPDGPDNTELSVTGLTIQE